MANLTKQNKTVVVAALTLFLASLGATLFFLSEDINKGGHGDLKADVIHEANNASSPSSLQDYQEYFNLLHDQQGMLMGITLEGHIEISFPDVSLQGKQFFDLMAPTDLPNFISTLGKVVTSETAVTMVGPYRLQDKQGNWHWYMTSLYPFKKHDKVTGIVVIARDISENLQHENTPVINEKNDKVNTEEGKTKIFSARGI